METPKFKNRPNDHVVYQFNSEATGIKVHQDFWVSRANAVDGVVIAIVDDGIIKILITKRSDKMRDEAGKYCIPCGYLDWNETRHEAMIREVYEETSLYLPDYEKYIIFDNNKQPFMVKDNPNDSMHQNISHIYVTVLNFGGNMLDFPQEIESFTCRETSMVRWITSTDFYTVVRDYAFNHDIAIKEAIQFFTLNYNG